MAKFPVAWTYVATSLMVIAGMAYDEGARHRAFFPTVTALSSNNLFHVALANGFFAALYATCWIVTRMFLGRLDQSERLTVTEKFFVCFIDSVLGLAIFRTNLNYWTVVQVTCTIAWRMLHYLAIARQESMEQAVRMTLWRVLRFMSLLSVLFAGDVAVSIYFWDASRRDGVGLPTLLCVDYMVMGVLAVAVTCKTLLQLYEQYRGGIWEPRGTYRFYCDIATEALSCVFYIAFFIVVTRYTTTPFHIVRHLIDNLRRFTRAVKDCATYRTLCAKLARLPDPTPEQLEADSTCSVCLGDIETPNGAKRLPCGHSFHSQCLTRWLERNNNCPYCRQEIEAMLARVAAAATPVQVQRPPAPPPQGQQPQGGPQQQPNQPGGGLDPFDALQDDAAIRRMYQQYLQLHRAANVHVQRAPEEKNADDEQPARPAPAAAAAASDASGDSSESSAAGDGAAAAAPPVAAPASPASPALDARRAAAEAALARARKAAEEARTAVQASSTQPTAAQAAAPETAAPAAESATQPANPQTDTTRLQRRLQALEKYRERVQEAERLLEAELAAYA